MGIILESMTINALTWIKGFGIIKETKRIKETVMIRRIGMRAHDYGQHVIEETAEMIQKDGFTTIQLALKKACADFTSFDDMLIPEKATAICTALASHDVDISVLGVYLNYAHQDPETRGKAVDIACQHMRLFHEFGCQVVGTETGSLDPNYNWHPDNHSALALNEFAKGIEKILITADEVKGSFAVEAVAHHIIHTPQRMNEFIKTMSDPNLYVIFDPVNIITVDNAHRQKQLMYDMFELLDGRIRVIHAKDFIIEDGRVRVVRPGQGMLDYNYLMELIQHSHTPMDVLAEDISSQYLTEVREFLERKALEV